MGGAERLRENGRCSIGMRTMWEPLLSYDSHASRMEKHSMWGAIMQAAEVGLKAVFISA
jgi:hypothetical protein